MKKGILGFGAYPVVIAVLIVMGIIIIFLVINSGQGELEEIRDNNDILDTGMTTRTIVSYEIEEGYAVYDLLYEYEQTRDEDLRKDLRDVIKEFDIDNEHEWYVRIGDESFFLERNGNGLEIRQAASRQSTIFDQLPPGVILPGDEETIPVLIERTSILDEMTDEELLERTRALRVL